MSVLSDIAAENYLKSIVKACAARDKDTLTTGEVAKLLSVTPGNATMMIKKLEKDGYLEYKSYHGCKLTEKAVCTVFPSYADIEFWKPSSADFSP